MENIVMVVRDGWRAEHKEARGVDLEDLMRDYDAQDQEAAE